ncbi:uncharacterized protein PAC_08035 [Phialocephala subalpina]|uniref:C2H2-type domain-containing protein n=1 Tax=Phialocephala subalpina TaxID=576137 RepID=A0A1L7WZG2_9HELO|nr:uncharacterized protein PAC_08035 [Phialocephala subalpina]
MDVLEIGFDSSGYQDLLLGNQLSNDSSSIQDDLGRATTQFDDIIGNLEGLYAPTLPPLPFETLNFDLADSDTALMASGTCDFDMSSSFYILSSESPSALGSTPPTSEMITSSSPAPSQAQTPNIPPQLPAAHQPSQRFHCPVTGCSKHYKRKHELKRHQKDHAPKRHHCSISGCNRSGQYGFARRDHLRQHMRKVHGTGL